MASNFKLVVGRHPCAAGRPGAGAPPLPEPGPLHARPHEREQELRRMPAPGRGDDWRHGGRGGGEPPPKYAVGDKVVGMGGWQEYSVVDANAPGVLRKVDTTHVPLSHYLGAVGMPGVTAWYGLVQDHCPQGRRDRGGERCDRRRGQRLWLPWPRPAAAAWWALPVVPDKCQLRDRRAGL